MDRENTSQGGRRFQDEDDEKVYKTEEVDFKKAQEYLGVDNEGGRK